MRCANCGCELPDDAKFCRNCGAKVEKEEQKQKQEEGRTILLRCKACGGTLKAQEGSPVLTCPYCGSQELIEESDDVAIARIKNKTYEDIELARIKQEKEDEERAEDQNELAAFKKSKLCKAIVVFFVLCLISCLGFLGSGKILAGLIAGLQTALFVFAWLMGMQVIKEKRKNFRVVLAAAAFALIIPASLAAGRNVGVHYGTYEWPSDGISTVLPQPPSNKGEIITNSGTSFYIHVSDLTKAQYDSYVKDCKTNGFTVDSSMDTTSYEAYNKDGYKVNLIYLSSEDQLSINLDAPKAFSTIQWPTTGAGALLPVPKSNVGSSEWESSDGFTVYIGKTTSDDYNAYVNACKEKGFSVDYRKGNNYFYADNADGYHLTVNYEGNQTMYINVYKHTS